MNEIQVNYKLPWGGGFSALTLINKHFIEYFKLKKVVFVVETTFSRGHFLDPPTQVFTTRKEDEWR